MNGEGHGVKQLFDSDGFEFTPAVSSNGKLLAFEHDDADFSDGGIYVGDKHGRDLDDFRRITTAPGLAAGGFDGNPDFSPDGTRIAFARVLDTTHGSGQSAIFVVGVDGTGLTQLTPYALDAERPAWSPDGTTIAFATNSDNFPTQGEIDAVPAGGGPITQLTHDPLPVQNFGPDWSPDGTRIVVRPLDGPVALRPDGDAPRRQRAHDALPRRRRQLRLPARVGVAAVSGRLARLALLAAAVACGPALAAGGAELATSNLNTPAGTLTALHAGAAYTAGSFPLGLAVTPPDGSWGGSQWRTSSHGKPAFGWAAFGRGPVDAPPQGLIEILTAFGSTPPAAAILDRIRSEGGGATFGKAQPVTLAGHRGSQVDGDVFGVFGHSFVPFSAKTGGASPADSYHVDRGEAFRLIVLDVDGRRVVVLLESAGLPADRFPSFLASAGRLLRTLRLGT